MNQYDYDYDTPTIKDTDLGIDEKIADMQAQIARADTKASILTGLSLGALTGGAALAGKAHLHGFSLAGAALTAVLIGAAVFLLGAAIRPALRGNQGLMRWASASSAHALYQDLAYEVDHYDRLDKLVDDATHLWLLARSARNKYQRVRRAVDLLGVALLCAAVTALLSALD